MQADPPNPVSTTAPVRTSVIEIAPPSALAGADLPATAGALNTSNLGTIAGAVENPLITNSAISGLSNLAAVTAFAGLSGASMGEQIAAGNANQACVHSGNYSKQSSVDGPAWISETEIEGGLIPAALLQSQSRQMSSGPQLVGGSLLVCSSHDQTIETPTAKVFVARESLALVIVTTCGTAVYNLHDCRSGAVALMVGAEKINVLPGTCAILSSSMSTFADQNPAQLIAYRHLCERIVAGNQKLIKGEFSLLSAASIIQPLPKLVSSRELVSRRTSGSFLKTAAIMEQLQAYGAPFELVPRREVAAFLGAANVQ